MTKPRRSGAVQPASHDPIDRRLTLVEGQVGGIRKMIAERRNCVELLTQLSATRAALAQVSIELLTHHLSDCPNGGGCASEKLLAELSEAERRVEMKAALNRLMK